MPTLERGLGEEPGEALPHPVELEQDTEGDREEAQKEPYGLFLAEFSAGQRPGFGAFYLRCYMDG